MQDIPALYRLYLRQVRALPHVHLRHFFSLKARDDFHSVLRTKSFQLRRRKFKRISHDLQRLRAANSGRSTAFDRILDLAYGRAGKLRRELLEPLLSDPNAPSAGSSRKERTALPTYSPQLVALLTSGISHVTRPLQKRQLDSPPRLSQRTKVDPQNTMLLGPLSRRREYNIRWRFFGDETKKLYLPLQPTSQPDTHASTQSLLRFGIQNTGILHELLVLSGSKALNHPGEQCSQQTSDTSRVFDGSLPTRWLRRRYQALLGRIPLLTSRQNGSTTTYDVHLADSAITAPRTSSSRLRDVDTKDISWVNDVQSAADSKKHGK